MSENKAVKGYKVFNPDWTCRGFQYEVGKCYEMDERPVVCERGFHFCEELKDCYKYYEFNSDNKVAEITAYGKIDVDEYEKKSCTNKIKIEKEIVWDEVLAIVNIGKNCTGYKNTGDDNIGNFNTGDNNIGNFNTEDNNNGDCNSGNNNNGDCNTGDDNIGNFNTGDDNIGNFNTEDNNNGDCNSGNNNNGDCNTGNNNIGNFNSGNRNNGDYNSGNRNNGDYNSGNRNNGDYNSGNCNNGDNNSGNYNNGYYNIGNRNKGDCNSGNHNNGDCNSGNYNSGDWNTGDWNATNYSSGCFNTVKPKIFLFNKMSDWTIEDWINSKAKDILDNMDVEPTQKICKEDMTDREKEEHPEYQTLGFYSKELSQREIAEERQQYWNRLSQQQKDIVMAIPNFDKAIFKEVTGIDVDGE